MRAAGRSVLLVVAVLAAVAAVVWLLDPWSAEVPRQVGTGADEVSVPEPVQVGEVSEEEPPQVENAPGERVALPASVSPSTAPSPMQLWGRVVDAADGAPIAGADVRLQHRAADEFWNLDLDYGAHIDELDRTESDTEGRFRFDVTRAREHRLHVSATGYAATTALNCTGGSEVVVELSRGASIDGVVVCSGVGVADVAVRVAVRGESVELAKLRTERDGVFRVAGLPPVPVYVQVNSRAHDVVWKRLDLKDGQTHRIEIEVVEGQSLAGRVIDAATKRPIAGAELSDSWTFRRRVLSAADGSFALGGLKDEGFVEVHVRAEGYARASRNLSGELGEEIEFALVRGGEVTGRFVGDDGAPVGDVYAAVGASYMAGPGVQSTDWIRAHVRETGVFAALGLRPDQHYWLYVRGRGYGTRVYALPRRLTAGERIDVGDIVLRPAGGIEGRVAKDGGAPFAGVEVSIRGSNTDAETFLEQSSRPTHVSQFESHDTATDSQGLFRFTNLAEGRYEVSVRLRGHPQTISIEAEVQAGAITENVELIVPLGERIAGTLSYANGRALGDEVAQLILTAWREHGQSASAGVGGDGRFAFSGLEEGSYVLSLPRALDGWALRPVRGVATGREDLQLQLEPASVIAGRVLDAAGNPIKARVYVRYGDRTAGGSALHSTDDEGRFRIEVPPDFRGYVGAMHPKQLMSRAGLDDVAAGQTDLELRFQ